MQKFYVKVNNVYFARRWFVDRFGRESEGQLCLIASKLMAVSYDSIDAIQKDMESLSINVEQIEVEKVG